MKNKYITSFLAIGLMATTAAFAAAEDYTYSPQQVITAAPEISQSQPQVPVAQNDQDYNLPLSYQGRYYSEEQNAVGYYGTQKSAESKNPSGYYHYYY